MIGFQVKWHLLSLLVETVRSSSAEDFCSSCSASFPSLERPDESLLIELSIDIDVFYNLFDWQELFFLCDSRSAK